MEKYILELDEEYTVSYKCGTSDLTFWMTETRKIEGKINRLLTGIKITYECLYPGGMEFMKQELCFFFHSVLMQMIVDSTT